MRLIPLGWDKFFPENVNVGGVIEGNKLVSALPDNVQSCMVDSQLAAKGPHKTSSKASNSEDLRIGFFFSVLVDVPHCICKDNIR